MKLFSIISPVLGAICAAVSVQANPIAERDIYQGSGSYSFTTLVPPCYQAPDQEFVNFDFDYKYHWKQTVKGDVMTYKYHWKGHGTGVGETSGDKYQYLQVSNEDFTYQQTYPWSNSWHYVIKYKIVRQGGGVEYESFANIKTTCDVNGCTSQVDNVRYTC